MWSMVTSFVAFLALLGAFFLPYSEVTGGKSLFHTPFDIALNLGLLVAVALAAIFSSSLKTVAIGVIISTAALLWWIPGVVSNVVGVSSHHDSLNVGAYLAFVGVGALAVNSIIGISNHYPSFRVSRESIWTSVSCCCLGILWVVGEYLPWSRTLYKSSLPTVTFNASGSRIVVNDCCSLFTGYYSAADTTQYLLKMALVLAGTIGMAFLAKRLWRGIGLAAIAVTFSGEVLTGIQQLGPQRLSDSYVGASLTQAIQNHVSVTVSALPGLWLNLAAELGLLILGVYLVIATRLPDTYEPLNRLV